MNQSKVAFALFTLKNFETELKKDEKSRLKDLILQQDVSTIASFALFKVDNDKNELLDSLKLLLKRQPPTVEKNQIENSNRINLIENNPLLKNSFQSNSIESSKKPVQTSFVKPSFEPKLNSFPSSVQSTVSNHSKPSKSLHQTTLRFEKSGKLGFSKPSHHDASSINDSQRQLSTFLAFQSLTPPNEEAYEIVFELMADQLLNEVDLVVAGGRIFHLAEIEVYYKGGEHQDPFTHCDESKTKAMACLNSVVGQQRFLHWYFHRFNGKSFKEGSYKGLDLSFGDEKNNCYGGFLIRSLYDVANKQLIEGPSLCVDALIKATGASNVKHLARTVLPNTNAVSSDPSHPLRLMASTMRRADVIHRSMRVGLTLKNRADLHGRLRFIGSLYRFMTRCSQMQKGFANTVAALAATGKPVAEIATILNRPTTSIKNNYDRFYFGYYQMNLETFVGKALAGSDYAELYGRYYADRGFAIERTIE